MDAPMSPEDRSPKRAKNSQHGRPSAEAKAPGDASAPSNASRTRLILLAAGVAVMAALGFFALRPAPLPQASSTASTGVAAIGGPFTMVDTEGRPATEAILQGKWSLVFFGYTYCPDICPATMTALSAAKLQMAPAQAAQLQTVFVSIDPERDTPAQLKAYLQSPAFPRPMVGLTGSPEQVKATAHAYRVFYARHGEGADYLMDHNSAIYLMNPQGAFVRLVRPDAKPRDMAREIGGAMGRNRS
jgi:protein SCO1/2